MHTVRVRRGTINHCGNKMWQLGRTKKLSSFSGLRETISYRCRSRLCSSTYHYRTYVLTSRLTNITGSWWENLRSGTVTDGRQRSVAVPPASVCRHKPTGIWILEP